MRGLGRVYQRGAGRAWWIAYYAGGRDRRESVARALRKPVGQVTLRDAERLLKHRLAQKARGEILAAPAQRLTVSALMDHYEAHLVTKGVKRLASIRSHIKAVRRWLGDRRAASLTTATLKEAIDTELATRPRPTAKPYARGTVKTRLYTLRAALEVAKQDRLLAAVPDIPALTVDNTRQGFFEPEIFARVLAHLPEDLRDLARFGYLTGWRKAEILGLTWDRIDRRAGTIRLSIAKTGPRVRPYLEDPELAAVIDRRWRARALGCPYVFHRGGRMIRSIYRAWDRGCAKAGVPGAWLHDVRRTAYRNLVEGGMDLFTAMELTGHTSLSTAQRYNIVELARMRSALSRAAASDTYKARTRLRLGGRRRQS